MEKEPEADLQLVARVKNGDLSAYQSLVEIYRERVVSIAYRFCSDFHLAEDIAQDSFVRAYGKIEQYDEGKGAFSSWLFQITKRLALNSGRKSVPFPVSAIPEAVDSGDSPSDVARRRDHFRALDAALEELREPYRSAFVLAEIEELPLQVVAEIEGVPVGTIKSRIHRAKTFLREALKLNHPNHP